MEVGQPAASAPQTALAAARAALDAPLRYTETLGIPSLRTRIARHYAESYGVTIAPDEHFENAAIVNADMVRNCEEIPEKAMKGYIQGENYIVPLN